MPNLEWVFYGFTLYDLLLSLGRFLIAVTGSLLALHNLLWLVRCKWKRDPRPIRRVRAVLELVIGATLGGIYALQIAEVWRTGAAAALAPGETLVVVWAFAILSTGLLVSAMTEQP